MGLFLDAYRNVRERPGDPEVVAGLLLMVIAVWTIFLGLFTLIGTIS